MDRGRLWRICFRIAYDDYKRYKVIAIAEGVVIVALLSALAVIL